MTGPADGKPQPCNKNSERELNCCGARTRVYPDTCTTADRLLLFAPGPTDFTWADWGVKFLYILEV